MVVHDNYEYLTEEEKRLKEDKNRKKYWKKWGPYVAERQWATGKVSAARLGFIFCAEHMTKLTYILILPEQFAKTIALTAMPGVVCKLHPSVTEIFGSTLYLIGC